MTAIDISYWQGHPDFTQVKAAGVSLVIMKCGGGEGGRLYTDSVYMANRASARAQGLAVGSYFFNGPVDPTAAADYQWSIIDWRPGDIVAIDVENSIGVTRWTPAQVLAWVNRIRSHGVLASRILIYMSSSVTQLRTTPKALPGSAWLDVVATGVGLWVAQYGTNNGTPQGSPSIAGWPSWALWQYTSAKTWPGIVGNVDTNQVAASWVSDGDTPLTPAQPFKKFYRLRRDEMTDSILWYVPKASTDGTIKAGTAWFQRTPGAAIVQLDGNGVVGQSSEYTALLNLNYRMNDGTPGKDDNPEALRNFYTQINGDDLLKLIAVRGLVPVYDASGAVSNGEPITDEAAILKAIAAIPVGATPTDVTSAVQAGADAVIAKIPTQFVAK